MLIRKLLNGRRATCGNIRARVQEQVNAAGGNPEYLVEELTRMFTDFNDFQVATKKIVGGEFFNSLF